MSVTVIRVGNCMVRKKIKIVPGPTTQKKREKVTL